MASGYPFRASGNEFYDMYHSLNFNNNGGVGAGSGSSAAVNNGQVRLSLAQTQNHLQQQHPQYAMDQIPPRGNSMAKRSVSEMLQLQQQQQALLRSVKPRNHQYNQNSPISPLTPFDFSGAGQAAYSLHSQPHLQPLQQQLQPQPLQQQLQLQPLQQQLQLRSMSSLSTSSQSFTNSIRANHVVGEEKMGETNKKMKNCLQELEKQLFDDIDEEPEAFGEAGSVVSSEWSQTMQNLISQTPKQTQNQNQNPIPKPFSPTPTSSSSSTTSSSSSPLNQSAKQTFIDVATAISEENLEAAVAKVESLKQISNHKGDAEQRLSSYMVSAFLSRLSPANNPPPVQELSSNDQLTSTQLLYEASPCFKLAFMTSIQAILDATRDLPSIIHVLDFDIGQGSHYLTLIHKIAERQHIKQNSMLTSSLLPTSFVKITSVNSGRSDFENKVIADRLKMLADRLGIGFKFNSVTKPISELNLNSLPINPNEALVVNFAFRLSKLSDESVSTENPRDSLLRLVKSLGPRVVTVLEQELNTNTAPFATRVAEASGYYQALLNSLDSVTAGPERARVEACLGRKLVNAVACEGSERVERCEVFGKWRARMRMAGFVGRPIGGHVAEGMRARLSAVYKNNSGFTVKEDGEGVCFGWMDRVLTVASAWC